MPRIANRPTATTPALFCAALLSACSGPPATPVPPDPAPAPKWDRALPRTADAFPVRRGLRTVRGPIHLHSVYSHDACDNLPLPNGQPSQPCFQDLRDALCSTRQDFAMLTDHATSMTTHTWSELFLPRPGDEAVMKSGVQAAARLACPDGSRVLALVGGENTLMPVGLEREVAADAETRDRIMTATDRKSMDLVRQSGGIVLVAHGEGRSLEMIREVGAEGMEVYNLHANIDPKIRAGELGLVGAEVTAPIVRLGKVGLFDQRPDAPVPDLAFLALFEENPAELGKYDTLLGEGRHLFGTLGADAHQNAFPALLADGERGDSYRRVLRWFENHFLVPELTSDALKDALRHGRGYGAFEVFGTPSGFDYRAEVAGRVAEMGETVKAAAAPALVVEAPHLARSASQEAPRLRVRLLRVDGGGTREVASGDGATPLRFVATVPGAYRVEVRITPNHLKPFMGGGAAILLHEYVWIYANPIYVE